ncbi:protein of unknown function [Modestobacter italicus]|uniref:Uncharacterized protein n=1 Tax=Modestobacter italicus (strain DSM 44449 / CECT 9708 / BC 501) TaxID=2732864 RepID=I4EVJ6_MODI5|nr:protein of unknown function [Modestobacter marinus]
MNTTSRVEQPVECEARPRAVSGSEIPTVVGRRAVRCAASVRSLRWALAFYGGFCSIPVGMAAATWFGE